MDKKTYIMENMSKPLLTLRRLGSPNLEQKVATIMTE